MTAAALTLKNRMDTSSRKPLLVYPPGAVQEIRKSYNLDHPDRLNQAIDILVEWLKKQEQLLKKDFTRDYLENVLIVNCKGSVEKTKKQIDKICTCKTLLPQFFTNTNMKVDLKEALDIISFAVLPVLTKELYRIILVKFNNKPIESKNCLQFFQGCINLLEYLKAHDYNNGLILVYDLQEMNIQELLIKMNPVILQQYMSIALDGYGIRFKGLYIITQSKVVNLFVKLIKQFMNKKLSKRIYVTKTLKDLHSFLPKEIFPLEYGGNGESFSELSEEWVNELSRNEYVEYLKMMYNARTNETLRRADKFNEDYIGTPGSFRNMTLD